MNKKSLKISGAGPAGLTAAINLASAGYDVHVFEKRNDTGKRFHGDLQGLENWSSDFNVIHELERMNIYLNFDCTPVLSLITTNGKNQRVSRYAEDRPLCYLVKRGALVGSLDRGLKIQALEAGVKLHFNETISLTESNIVATGPISKEIFAVDKGIVFETDHEDVNVFLVNDEAAYRGYSYLLITKGYGCMCTVLFDKFSRLDDCYQKSKDILTDLISLDIRNLKSVAGIGCFSTKNTFEKDGVLYVGEAAGLQDLMWGFGIRTAMQSGYLAANCIIHNRSYPQAAKEIFDSKLKATLTGRFVWELIRAKDYAIVVNQKVNSNTKRALDLSFLYNFSLLHKMIYPVAQLVMRRRYPHLRI